MTSARTTHFTPSRTISAVAGLAVAALALSGCSSEPTADDADEPAQEAPQESDAGAEESADDADDAADDTDDDGDAADDDGDDAGDDDAGDDGADDDGDDGGEVDQACIEAAATFGLIEGALRVRAEQAPIDEQDIAETFGDFDPYAADLSAEAKVSYDTYHDAAVGAIGLADTEVDAVLDAADVQSAIDALTQMELMSACM